MSLDTHYSNVADSVLLFDSSDTLFAPGEEFEYSSFGTVLLSAVMQEASGKDYQKAMQDQVFSPLGLQSTMPEPAVPLRKSQAPELATFYWHPDLQENKVTPWREVDLSHRLAGGGFISTSSDLVKLGIGFNSSQFISAKTRDAFWQPQSLNNGEVNEQNYAIGWRVRESDFGEGIGTLFQANHGGVTRGAQSWLMVIPEYNMSVAVNINAKTDQFWDFAKVSYDLVNLFLTHRKSLEAEQASQAE
jgi:CubicO group peptidase (beta-lactamase class C family)